MVAAPAASAATPEECIQTYGYPPQLKAVTVNGLDVIIDPNQIEGDAFAVVDAVIRVYNLAWCIENGVIARPVFCRLNVYLSAALGVDPANGDLHYVTRDPVTGIITIHGSRVLADATSCL